MSNSNGEPWIEGAMIDGNNADVVRFGGGEKLIERGLPLQRGERGAVYHLCPQFAGEYPWKPGVHGIALNALAGNPVGGHNLIPALTLFDTIVLPPSAFIDKNSPDYIAICSHGVAQSPAIVARGHIMNATMRRDAFDVYRSREASEPGGWSMWCWSDDDPIPPDEAIADLAFRMRLQDALLIPDANVPIEEVFAFKDRRHPELVGLRHHLEEAAIRVSREGPDPRLARIEAEKIEGALSDYLRAAREPNWKKIVTSLDLEMNWAGAATSAATGAMALATTASPLVAAATMGLAAAGNLSLKSVRGFKAAEQKSPFAYMIEMERELGT